MPNSQTVLKRPYPLDRSHWFISTTIPFVNGPPHIGFALEMIQADVLARHRRAEGYQVRLQAGTDENSLKNVLAANAAGTDPKEFVRRNADRFLGLQKALNLTVDDFIRTSADQRHRVGVEKLWNACAANGDIYRKAYRGLYCVGCEQFYKASDLRDGRCPEHRMKPEEIAEENYFFRLSRYWDVLLKAIRTGRLTIEPASRRNEMLRLIESGLDDFSISRSAERAHGWGIPVPDDNSQVIYVWFDALANYITALGYGTDDDDFRRYWCSAGTREHIIGKGVTRFHAVYWPAMLLSAGLPLPTRIFVHGYVTVDGAKIGKSAGNAVDPFPIAGLFGADALRYFLLRHVRSGQDGDFTRQRLQTVYKSDLAGQLGNLTHRTIAMINRYCSGVIPAPEYRQGHGSLVLAARSLPAAVTHCTDNYAFDEALSRVWEVIALANRHISATEPWALARKAEDDQGSAEALAARIQLENCLFELAYTLFVVGGCLAHYLPATSDGLLRQLGAALGDGQPHNSINIAGNRVAGAEVLFPKIDA